MSEPSGRSVPALGLRASLRLLLQPVRTRVQARQLGRTGATIVVMVGGLLAFLGLLAGNNATVLDGMLLVAMAYLAGWYASRFAAVVLVLLMLMGLLVSISMGIPVLRLLIQFAVLMVCLRLAEAVFRLRTLP